MCAGRYPSPPLLRGGPFGYVLPGLAMLGAATFRRERRKGERRPWSSFRPRVLAALVVLTGAIVFVLAPSPSLATAWALVSLTALFALQRRWFLGAARAGAIAGYHMRPAEPADGGAPLLLLVGGPSQVEILERTFDPGYRESGRAPVVRIGRRSARRLVWIGAGLGVLALFVGCAALTMRTRKSEAVPAGVPVAPEPAAQSGMR